LIAAAGSGERLGAGGPKALVRAAGRPLLAWSVEAFAASPDVRAAVIVAPAGHEEAVEGAAAAWRSGGELEISVVPGGTTRAESVAAGLALVQDAIVAVHDAARPLVTPQLIASLLRALEARPDAAGVIAAIPIPDTVKRVGEDERTIERTENRERLWAAQTPQVFRTDALRKAHASTPTPGSATDDAMLLEAAGETVLIEPSPHPNLKVTTAADLRLAESLLAS
jgi:2-C-methyl-D-erythritol 4-phosphate cytidylyltransferase